MKTTLFLAVLSVWRSLRPGRAEQSGESGVVGLAAPAGVGRRPHHATGYLRPRPSDEGLRRGQSLSGNLGMIGPEELDGLTPGEVQRLAAANQPRRFIAAELLYAWITEPEVWENRPILRADDETLRGNVLQVPLIGEDGRRLKYVSPRQVEDSRMFAEQWLAVVAKLRQAQQRKPQTGAYALGPEDQGPQRRPDHVPAT